jgi:hypothetical protein
MRTGSRRRMVVVVVALATAGLGGCGARTTTDAPPPPTPVDVLASIDATGISVRPAVVDAGPVVIVITNATAHAQAVTIVGGSADDDPAATVMQRTTPINPAGVARVALELPVGSYRLSTDDRRVHPAALRARERTEAHPHAAGPRGARSAA